MSQHDARVSEWMDRTVVDPTGAKVGAVSDVFVDDETNEPDWLTVATGMFGTKVSFVPIEGARLDGDVVVVAYDKDKIKEAPRTDADEALSAQDEQTLYDYYGRGYTPRATTLPAPTEAPIADAQTDASMVRSEEELSIDKHRQEAGRVRLRKWVETENVQVTVPVERQMARVIREPVRDGDSTGVGEFVEGEEEIVLSEEVVDVSKRVVAKERIGLEKETVIEQVSVDETVRKERVEVDGDTIVGDAEGRTR